MILQSTDPSPLVEGHALELTTKGAVFGVKVFPDAGRIVVDLRSPRSLFLQP